MRFRWCVSIRQKNWYLKNTNAVSATRTIWSRRRKLLIGQYFKEDVGADFVFVTHYPSKKRPFYAMDDPADPTFTLSFDLLFHGLEITTGGQRIHDYEKLREKIAARGMTEEGMEQYLDTFKYGLAASRRTWHRSGTVDDEALRRGKRPRRHCSRGYFPGLRAITNSYRPQQNGAKRHPDVVS